MCPAVLLDVINFKTCLYIMQIQAGMPVHGKWDLQTLVWFDFVQQGGLLLGVIIELWWFLMTWCMSCLILLVAVNTSPTFNVKLIWLYTCSTLNPKHCNIVTLCVDSHQFVLLSVFTHSFFHLNAWLMFHSSLYCMAFHIHLITVEHCMIIIECSVVVLIKC